MRIGAEFPSTESTDDVGSLRAFAQAVEEMGYTDIHIYDHVLGASSAHYDKTMLTGPYREHDKFHEAFVIFGFWAGITSKVGFSTNVLVSPQRQTVLIAKQAAEVDLLCGGRLRLGIGTGWNTVEYEGLGVPFAERGARQEEQIRLLRELWTKPIVDFKGRFHQVTHAGINPMPVQRPIPIWLGGMAEAVIKRVGTLADGWFPVFPSLGGPRPKSIDMKEEPPIEIVERMRGYARAAGRDPSKIGISGDLWYGKNTPDDWHRFMEGFRKIGATHIIVNTLGAGLKGIDAHIEALRKVKAAVS
jgi:probable F420-dependent oxidoreductase